MNMDDYRNVVNRLEPDEKCRNEVLDMSIEKKRTKIKKSAGKKSAVIIIAAIVAAMGGTAAAAGHFGVFDRMNQNSTRTVTNDWDDEFPVDKFDKKDYEAIGKYAQELETPVSAGTNGISEDGETENIVSADTDEIPADEKTERIVPPDTDGISVSAESVYCDGRCLILGITGQLASGNPNGAGYIHFSEDIALGDDDYLNEQRLASCEGNLILDEGTENSFTGNVTFYFNRYYMLEEPTTVNVKLSNFLCSEKYWTDILETVDGDVNLSFDVTPDLSLYKKFGLKDGVFKEDDYKVRIYELSPVMMTISAEYPEWCDANIETVPVYYNGEYQGEGPKYSIVPVYYDEYGSQLPYLGTGIYVDDHGTYAGCLQAPPTNKIIVKFCNKQEYDENGEMMVVKEMTVDLSETETAE